MKKPPKRKDSVQTLRIDQNRLLIVAYFIFKTVPTAVAGTSIYLGYHLFILGVTGEASLSLETSTLRGQLINAAPGLFFAVGGLICLGLVVWKGVNIHFSDPNGGSILAAAERISSGYNIQELLFALALEVAGSGSPWWRHSRRKEWAGPSKSPLFNALENAGVKIIDPTGRIFDSELKQMVQWSTLTYSDEVVEPIVNETFSPIIVYHDYIIPGLVSVISPSRGSKRIK